MKETSTGLKENVEITICYLFTFISGLFFLVSEKENKKVKYHAMQAILFGFLVHIIPVILCFTIVGIVLIPLVVVISMIFWIHFMYVAYHGIDFRVKMFEETIKKLFNDGYFD